MSESQGQFAQDEILTEEMGNRITEIVVFTDQAYLKRQARVQAQAGLNRFFMEVRAFAVDVDSVQANVYGEGEILSVQYKQIPMKEMPQEDVRTLDEKKEQLTLQRRGLENRKTVHEKQQRFLDSTLSFAEVEMPRKIKTQFPQVDDLRMMVAFLGETYQTLAEKIRELDHQIEELDKEIAVTERRLQKLQRPKDAAQKGIEVLFESRLEQEIRLEVFYVAQNATWEPVYKVDVPLELSRVRLTMFARIQQETGEHWKNVRLAVSNAIPLKGAALPEVESWYVSLPPKTPMTRSPVEMAAAAPKLKARRQHFGNAGEAMLEEDAEAFEPETALFEAEFIQAEQKELPLAFEYELPQSINMDSGGGDTMLPLYTKDMQGEFFIYAAPRYDPLAYLVCQASPDSELLAGKLNVHFGGRFVGGTALPEKKGGEELLVNLGAERGVKVWREKLLDKVTETFFGKIDRLTTARELEYRIVIENLKDETVRIRLFDSIPVSKIDRIQVKIVETVPEPTMKDYHNREGVMLWDVQVDSKAMQEIRIKFFVKHPKDNPPQGL